VDGWVIAKYIFALIDRDACTVLGALTLTILSNTVLIPM
jgi:hypothetical protein